MIAFGTLVGMLAAAGAFRWIGKAIVLLFVFIVLGVGPALAAMAAGALFGIARGILDAHLHGELR